MRNRRLMLIGLVVVVGGIAAALLLPRLLGQQDVEETPTPTPTPLGMVPIVVSAQNIAPGMELTDDAVILQDWPVDALPTGAFTDLEEVYGEMVSVNVPRGMPIVEDMLIELTVGAGAGSLASWMIPEGQGMVAYALPATRYTSVAWALRPGDSVDVLISFLLTDLDEEFQTTLPNMAYCFSPPPGEECQNSPLGRFEVLPNGWLVNLTPNGNQVPRLVTQMTVQNALVLQVGDWEEDPVAETAEPTPEATGEEAAAEEPVAEEGAVIEEASPSERAVTLAITRQDAEILEFARLSNARITLVLRHATDDAIAGTSPVTLQYLMDRYNIETPPKLPYGITPPVNTIPAR
ncbi:MAG: Flp pilus assembly protein CpaB [Anaerolineae bacterium]|nr:Flp pilus assembly protein CpaB [Anaerolineae bacterium]